MYSIDAAAISQYNFKDTVTPAEQCDFVGVNLEKFMNFFKFFAFVLKEWRNYRAQYGPFYYKRQPK